MSAQGGHKRVNSIGSGLQSKKNSNDSSNGIIFTPTSHTGGKFSANMNFGFGNASGVLNQLEGSGQQQHSYLN